jgi:putative (di)nucleoside polyphosphate hydrolase
MLRLIGGEADMRLDLGEKPEFDDWRWVDYWYPMDQVVSFKQDVYRSALEELAFLIQPPLKRRPPRSAPS